MGLVPAPSDRNCLKTNHCLGTAFSQGRALDTAQKSSKLNNQNVPDLLSVLLQQ